MSTQPLWSDTNFTQYSDMFRVPPGKVCVLFAQGLENVRTKTSTSEFTGPQVICVRRVLFSPEFGFAKNATCDWVQSATVATKIVDELVQVCGQCWTLTPTNNLGIIGVPGVYRLEINDTTAIQVAQVYAELFDADALPPQIAPVFFA